MHQDSESTQPIDGLPIGQGYPLCDRLDSLEQMSTHTMQMMVRQGRELANQSKIIDDLMEVAQAQQKALQKLTSIIRKRRSDTWP